MQEDKFIEFENGSMVLEYRYEYKDILIWPYVRDILFRNVWEVKHGYLPHFRSQVKENKYRDYIKYNSFNLPKSDILFFAEPIHLIETKDKIFDRLIDEFVKVNKGVSAKILRHTKEFDFEKLSRMGIPFSTTEFIKKMIEYETKKQKISDRDLKTIDKFIDYLKKEVPFEVEEGIYEGIRQRAIGVIKSFPAYYKYYQKLIDIVQPKLAIFHVGVYGWPEIKVFNDWGVVTAEYQHCAIDRHWDYMYGKSVAESAIYREYMPQYLLTWGSYWTRDINVPANIYKIGNPTVQREIENFKKLKLDVDAEFRILIITDDEHEWYVNFIHYLLENLSTDFRIIVKLHPLLLDAAKYYEPFLYNERVEVKREGWIYDYFTMCKYVVGDTSTALYEAAAVGKDVFIVDNEMIGNYTQGEFGIKIKNGQQFIEKMNIQREERFCDEDFFGNDWRKNYQTFLRDAVGLKI